MSKLQNAILFQITWFACVFGSANDLVWPGLLCCLVFTIWQLSPKRRHQNDFKLVIFACIIGLLVDTAWIQFGFFHYEQHWPHSDIAPIWIIALWVAFALSINHSLAWLNAHPILPALMGLMGAPLSYWAGQRIGAIGFTERPLLALICLALTWAAVLSFLFRKSQQETPTPMP